MDDGTFFWAIIEPVWPDASVAEELEHIASATPGQRAIYVLTLFIREVDNGGLWQFFYNSSGMYSQEVRNALALLGVHDHLAIFEKAIKIFSSSRVPVNRAERIRVLNKLSKRQKQTLESLEERLFGEERLWPYFRRYVEQHPDEFFTDEASA